MKVPDTGELSVTVCLGIRIDHQVRQITKPGGVFDGCSNSWIGIMHANYLHLTAVELMFLMLTKQQDT